MHVLITLVNLEAENPSLFLMCIYQKSDLLNVIDLNMSDFFTSRQPQQNNESTIEDNIEDRVEEEPQTQSKTETKVT